MPTSVLESVSEYHIEPALSAPTPRRVLLPIGTTVLLWVAFIVFGFLIVGGGRALVEAGKLYWLASAGHPIAARVVAIKTQPIGLNKQPRVQTDLTYVFDVPADNSFPKKGVAHLGWRDMAVDQGSTEWKSWKTTRQAPPPSYHVGDLIPFRYVQWRGQLLIHPWQQPPTGKMVFLTFVGVLVIGVSLVFLQRLFFWYRHRVTLLRHGIATVGTIIHKRVSTDDAARYYVSYGYENLNGDDFWEHEEQCNAGQWSMLEIGQPVTVLFHPDRPRQAGLYALIVSH